MTESDLRIDFEGITAAWRYNDGEVWIEFAPDRPAEPAFFDVIHDASGDANEALSPDEFGTDVHGSVAGGVVKLKFPPGREALHEWLRVFARQVRAGGWDGSLHAAPGVGQPRWLRDLHEPRLTTYASYDLARSDAHWPDLCDKAAQWAQRNGGRYACLLSSGLTLPERTGKLGRHMYLALTAGSSVSGTYLSAKPGPLSQVDLVADGHASYQVYDPEFEPVVMARRAREALLVDCERTRWAGVGLSNQPSYGWQSLTKSLGHLPPAPKRVGFNYPAWSRYIPDAFGMQLLTDEHLSRVRDLSAWTVTEPAPGRHLVEAPDLADWFGPAGPSEQVLAAARADFGPVIAPADLPEQ